jgi:two-component system KDP operon response regulator KdpE
MTKADKKHRVLVVDDHPKLLRFIEIDLKLRGFEVMTTTSGEEALKMVMSARPDIVLLDVIMPGMNGFDVLKKLRNFTQLPVIAFSASPGNKEGALELGANDFINKPFQPDEMARRITALLDHSQAESGGLCPGTMQGESEGKCRTLS